MSNSNEVLIGVLAEDSWLPLEHVAAVCTVEPEWLLRHIEDGLLPGATSIADTWHLSSAGLLRARRMRQVERDFDAGPELAALVGDMLEEIDRLRGLVRR
jgi:chaperone modulatory protein CbpM